MEFLKGEGVRSEGAFKIRGHESYSKERERRDRRLLTEYAETGWECGDDANYVSYATIPARFIYKI